MLFDFMLFRILFDILFFRFLFDGLVKFSLFYSLKFSNFSYYLFIEDVESLFLF